MGLKIYDCVENLFCIEVEYFRPFDGLHLRQQGATTDQKCESQENKPCDLEKLFHGQPFRRGSGRRMQASPVGLGQSVIVSPLSQQ